MIKDIPGLLERVTREIHEFTNIAVVGLSGGADSTLVAMLCKLALGETNVYGIHMPYDEKDMKTFNKDSKAFAKYIGINEAFYHIGHACKAIVANSRSFNAKKVLGNVKARVRMTILYLHCELLADKFKNKKVRVMGTDNLSENYIGYFTKGGDGQVDCNPIEDLYKSEVYQLLDYFIIKGMLTEEHVNRIPSAGLWENQTDESELGITYDELERCIRDIQENHILTVNGLKVLEMHRNTEHKRIVPIKINLRHYCE